MPDTKIVNGETVYLYYNNEIVTMVAKIINDVPEEKLSDWECSFLVDMSEKTEFTEKQKEKIEQIYSKYTK